MKNSIKSRVVTPCHELAFSDQEETTDPDEPGGQSGHPQHMVLATNPPVTAHHLSHRLLHLLWSPWMIIEVHHES